MLSKEEFKAQMASWHTYGIAVACGATPDYYVEIKAPSIEHAAHMVLVLIGSFRIQDGLDTKDETGQVTSRVFDAGVLQALVNRLD